MIRLFFIIPVAVLFGGLVCAQEKDNEIGAADGALTADGIPRVGILLDTSAEMGFLIPQVRKELRLINEELKALGRDPIPLREMKGSGLDREVTLSIPARLNALHAVRALYQKDKADTVYWITALKGRQSLGGFFDLEKEIDIEEEGRLPRKLVIRNVWQEQLQRASSVLRSGSELEGDPLDLKERPESWYRLVSEGRGTIMRSWQTPPVAFREQFGLPWRVRHSIWLKKAEYGGGMAEFDQRWALELAQRHELHFIGTKEEWFHYYSPFDWIMKSSLIPFPDEAASGDRDEKLVSEMSRRDSIDEDLATIEAEKLGVLFSFGYVRKELNRYSREENLRHSVGRFIADTISLVRESRQHEEGFQAAATEAEKASRLYANEMVELEHQRRRLEGPDPVAKRVAQMVRNDGVDAIYLFTNGFTGGDSYGSSTIDEELLALAIREAGVKLYVRMPFETGSAPISLERLALASGGGVFRGKQGDPDWEIEQPSPRWPGDGEGKSKAP